MVKPSKATPSYRYTLGLLAAAAIAFPLKAISFGIPKLSLDEMVAKSSLVVVAQAMYQESTIPYNKFNFHMRSMRVLKTLKGEAPAELYLLVEGPAAEENLNCCQSGHNYLLFLAPIGVGGYRSVDGNWGAVSIDEGLQ